MACKRSEAAGVLRSAVPAGAAGVAGSQPLARQPLLPLRELEGAPLSLREADAAAMRAIRGWDCGCGERRELSLHEYAAWWRRRAAGQEHGALYVKDWHFAAEFPACQARRGSGAQTQHVRNNASPPATWRLTRLAPSPPPCLAGQTVSAVHSRSQQACRVSFGGSSGGSRSAL